MDTSALRNELAKSKKDLEERLLKIKEHYRHSNAGIEPDFEELATLRENDEVINNLGEKLQTELADINLALERIDNGTFGTCLKCGRDIPDARLNAIPYTSICGHCAGTQ